jgi:hypothetical protein
VASTETTPTTTTGTSGSTTATTTVPAGGAAKGATTVSFGDGLALAALVVAGVLLAGALVLRSRRPTRGAVAVGSVIRSWIAMALVLGLLVFCAMAFVVDDAALRNTLMGGLTTSVGAALAFYFSAKTSEKAQETVVAALQAKDGAPGGNEDEP